MRIEIKSKDDLMKATNNMHDSGFTNESIKYDSENHIFTITTKEYEYKGRFIQKKTDKVKANCRLTLRNVKNFVIEFTGGSNKKGYQSIGEDYFNEATIKDNIVMFVSTFQRMKLGIDNFDGEFEYIENLEV